MFDLSHIFASINQLCLDPYDISPHVWCVNINCWLGKSQFSVGESQLYLVGKSACFIARSPFLLGKTHYVYWVNLILLVDKWRFLGGQMPVPIWFFKRFNHQFEVT